MNIKAIETSYKGYRFRSRLEARWAVFFDAMGWEWLYEHEGYQSDNVRWLPDFYLPQHDLLVEVKPDWLLVDDQELYKLSAILDYHQGPDFLYNPGGGILLLDGIPFCEFGDGRPLFYGLVWLKGVMPVLYDICYPHIHSASRTIFDGWDKNVGFLIKDTLKDSERNGDPVLEYRHPFDFNFVYGCRSARSARFEHGESGCR